MAHKIEEYKKGTRFVIDNKIAKVTHTVGDRVCYKYEKEYTPEDREASGFLIGSYYGKNAVIIQQPKRSPKLDELERVTSSVIKWLARNHDPHTYIMIDTNGAELFKGQMKVVVD